MRRDGSCLRAVGIVLASVGLCTDAQSVFNVPVGSLAVLPEGTTRELEAPFTAIKPPQSTSQSTNGSLQTVQEANSTSFVSFTPAFANLLGSAPQLQLVAEKDYPFAHEGAVYLPNTNEVRASSCFCKPRSASLALAQYKQVTTGTDLVNQNKKDILESRKASEHDETHILCASSEEGACHCCHIDDIIKSLAAAFSDFHKF